MIYKFNTTEYFLGDIMPEIITSSREHFDVTVINNTKSGDNA